MDGAVKKAIPLVRAGAQVGPILAASGAFTEEMVRTLQVGEETGELDVELKRMAHTFQADAITQLGLLGGLFSKGIYFAIMGYAAFMIVRMYSGYMSDTAKAIDSMGQ